MAIVCLLGSTCAFDPVIVRNSGLRRAAGSMLWSCIKNNPITPDVCRPEVDAWCQKHGLEKGCGNDDAWGIKFDRKWN